MLLKDKLKKRIKEISIVSFDIFDTLLFRPYAKPIDLFQHMEKFFHKPLFCEQRIKAEQSARQSHPDLVDITYDMIYDEIETEYKEMQAKEKAWEKMVLRANPELLDVYKYAQEQGKKIVIASDMYLPSEFIAEILQKNGFNNWDKLYVSGEINAIKGNGSMFKQIISDFGVLPQQILHIGDNKKSDYKIPLKMQIKAIHYSSIYKQYCRANKCNFSLKHESKTSLGLSIIYSMMAYKWLLDKMQQKTSYNYWQRLGYQYSGPIGYGYTRFVTQTAQENNIDSLLFVARDGYLLEKIFKEFSTDIKHNYIYAPRFLNHICRLDYCNDKEAKTVIEYYAQENEEIKTLSKNMSNPSMFIEEHKQIFKDLSERQMQYYKQYIQRIVPTAKKYACVDTITGQFSSQKIIQQGLSAPILGIYWGICEDMFINTYQHKSFVGLCTTQDDRREKNYFTKNWNFIEFLITSPEHPIKNLDKDGNPIYENINNAYEIKRSELYPFIENGALDFTKDVNAWFKGADIHLTSQDIINWVNAYIEYPQKEDIKQMQNIKIAEDASHQIWIPLFGIKTKLIDFIKSPHKTVKVMKSMQWRTLFQSFLLCIGKPVSLRIHGMKKITMILCPYLKNKYMSMVFEMGKNWKYKVIIGKDK